MTDSKDHPLLKELTEQHPFTMMSLQGISDDLGIPYVFLVHEICEAWRFTRQVEDGAGE